MRSEKKAALERAEAVFAAGVLPIVDQIRQSGVIAQKGIAAALNARGICTFHGGRWHAVAVRCLLARPGTARLVVLAWRS
jgi:hypothetical protein